MTNLSKQDREEKYKLTSKISDPGSICAQKSDFDRLKYQNGAGRRPFICWKT